MQENLLAVGAVPWIPLGELAALPQTSSWLPSPQEPPPSLSAFWAPRATALALRSEIGGLAPPNMMGWIRRSSSCQLKCCHLLQMYAEYIPFAGVRLSAALCWWHVIGCQMFLAWFLHAKTPLTVTDRVKWRHRIYGHDTIAVLWV